MPALSRRRGALVSLAALAVAAVTSTSAIADTRVVRPGETLSEIAAAHGVDVASLAAHNGVRDPDRLLAGTRLRLDAVAAGRQRSYSVQPGDTLSALAKAAGTSVEALRSANSLADPNRLVAGQTLRLPEAGGAATPPAVAPAPPAEAPSSRGPSADEIAHVLETTARRYGWNPAYVKAIAWQESGWQMDVVSSAGAVGVMQVLPTTAVEMSRAFDLQRTLDPHDLEDNVLAGVLLLEMLDDLTGGDQRLMTASYFQGLANIRRDGMLERTEAYVANVLALRDRFAR